jgi:membrane-associated phospholipid phosphatase
MATAGALFMYLADEIGEQAWLTQVDLAVAQFFHDHGTPWAVRLFEAITFFGNASSLGVIGLVTALVLAFQRRWSLLLGWAVALIGAGELNVILKDIFRRLRPQLPDPWVTPSGWSFPSGHAMGSFVTYGFLAYLLTDAFSAYSGELIEEAGFPPGVTNICYRLWRDHRGSTRIGFRQIFEIAISWRENLSLSFSRAA